MKKNDFILLFAVLFISALFIIIPHKTEYDTVKIYKNGELYCEVSLFEDREIDIDGKNIAIIESGSVYMKKADCPDKLCVRQGKITDNAKKIVCLPNKVIIEVTKKSDLDTVVK